jgi:hypothetical protein
LFSVEPDPAIQTCFSCLKVLSTGYFFKASLLSISFLPWALGQHRISKRQAVRL